MAAGSLVWLTVPKANPRLASRSESAALNCPCMVLGRIYNPLSKGDYDPVRACGAWLCVCAGVAQLVEHDVANVVVVGSNPITRSCSSFLGQIGVQSCVAFAAPAVNSA